MTQQQEKHQHKKSQFRQSFAFALKALRKSKGLTQEDFSKLSSRTYFGYLEQAVKSPTLDKLNEIASMMDVHLATIIVLTSMYDKDINLNQMIDLIRSDLEQMQKTKNIYPPLPE